MFQTHVMWLDELLWSDEREPAADRPTYEPWTWGGRQIIIRHMCSQLVHTHTHIHHEVFDNRAAQPHHNNLYE